MKKMTLRDYYDYREDCEIIKAVKKQPGILKSVIFKNHVSFDDYKDFEYVYDKLIRKHIIREIVICRDSVFDALVLPFEYSIV